jgi:hypothetical protein
MTSNEMRQVVGMAPHPDPKADKLMNSNMPQGSDTPVAKEVLNLVPTLDETDPTLGKKVQNGSRG